MAIRPPGGSALPVAEVRCGLGDPARVVAAAASSRRAVTVARSRPGGIRIAVSCERPAARRARRNVPPLGPGPVVNGPSLGRGSAARRCRSSRSARRKAAVASGCARIETRWLRSAVAGDGDWRLRRDASQMRHRKCELPTRLRLTNQAPERQVLRFTNIIWLHCQTALVHKIFGESVEYPQNPRCSGALRIGLGSAKAASAVLSAALEALAAACVLYALTVHFSTSLVGGNTCK
jgi:hypothetical protein